MAVIRTATEEDAPDIYQLLRHANHSHVHVGWHLPIHWLGRKEFLVYEQAMSSNPFMRKLWGDDISLRACLVATANPAPVAWVQIAAVRELSRPIEVLATMLSQVETLLRSTAVTQIAWMPIDNWPDEWLVELGFTKINQVQTYYKQNMDVPEVRPVADLVIRPALNDDLPRLAQLEADTFEPLWRHSVSDLCAALTQAFSFDVAVWRNQIIGFQLSTCHDMMAHLARLTIAPANQKQGIGSALLASAIQGYKRQRIRSVSLNTQVDNLASHQLYTKFGFVARNQWYSIWSKSL